MLAVMPRMFNTTGPCNPTFLQSWMRELNASGKAIACYVSVERCHRDEINFLVGQYLADTGQSFSSVAVDRIWELTRGQPWLTNALCLKCVWTLCAKGEPVTRDHIEAGRAKT